MDRENEALNYLANLAIHLKDVAEELARIRKLMEAQQELAQRLCAPAERALEFMSFSSSESEE